MSIRLVPYKQDVELGNKISFPNPSLFPAPQQGTDFWNFTGYQPSTLLTASRKYGTIHQIRDQQFYIEILMFNQLEGEYPLTVPFFMIDSLIIHESLQNPFATGEITFNTDFELLSRGSPAEVVVGDKTVPKMRAPYIDRTDGRNRVSIQIVPINTATSDTYDENIWAMSFDFVVTDIQDLNVPNSQRKKRKYILADERYQILSEKNMEWSTRLIAAGDMGMTKDQARLLTDEQSAIFPNICLQRILMAAGIQTDNSILNVGFDSSGVINTPNVPFFNLDVNNWDTATDVNDNKILYTSPANATLIDDIYHVLSHCMANDRGPVILDFGRSPNDKSWKLHSLKKMFESSSNNQIERLFIEDGSDLGKTPKIERAETDSNTSKNFTSSLASRIQRYKFVPMVAADDNRILNSPLHYFDFQNNQWNIWVEPNTVEEVEKTLSGFAKSGLYSHKVGDNPHVLLNLNKTKTEAIMTKHEYSTTKYIAPETPKNQMVLDTLFLGQAISFQAIGLTNRSPGKFIYIDKVAAGDRNPFDDRFLGQWMMTKVSHLFTQGNYITEVLATKLDAFNKIWSIKDPNY